LLFIENPEKKESVQQAPPPPVIEMARKLLTDAHEPTKIAGLKRLRSF